MKPLTPEEIAECDTEEYYRHLGMLEMLCERLRASTLERAFDISGPNPFEDYWEVIGILRRTQILLALGDYKKAHQCLNILTAPRHEHLDRVWDYALSNILCYLKEESE